MRKWGSQESGDASKVTLGVTVRRGRLRPTYPQPVPLRRPLLALRQDVAAALRSVAQSRDMDVFLFLCTHFCFPSRFRRAYTTCVIADNVNDRGQYRHLLSVTHMCRLLYFPHDSVRIL